MIIKRRERPSAGMNMTSAADISFMLLIFFLVTSSMNVDKGIVNRMPPSEDKSDIVDTQILADDVMNVSILGGGVVTVNDKVVRITDMKSLSETFIKERGTRHIINITTSPDAVYETYFGVLNELTAAYATVRNEYALKHYGKPFRRCSEEERTETYKAVPQRMTEMEGGVK